MPSFPAALKLSPGNGENNHLILNDLTGQMVAGVIGDLDGFYLARLFALSPALLKAIKALLADMDRLYGNDYWAATIVFDMEECKRIIREIEQDNVACLRPSESETGGSR